MPVDKKLINSLEDLQRETNRLRDEQERLAEDAQKKVAQAKVDYDFITEQVLKGEEQFKNDNAERIRKLEKRERDLIAGEDKINVRYRELEECERAHKNQVAIFMNTQKAMIKDNEDLVAKNEAILNAINKEQQSIIAVQEKNSLLLESIKAQSAHVEENSKQYAQAVSEAHDLNNAATEKSIEAAKALRDANDSLKAANGVKAFNEALLREIAHKQSLHDQTLEQIEAAIKAEEKQKKDVEDLINAYQSNLNVVQEVSERNKSEMIALRALQVALNAKERELKEREANIKTLEANVKI